MWIRVGKKKLIHSKHFSDWIRACLSIWLYPCPCSSVAVQNWNQRSIWPNLIIMSAQQPFQFQKRQLNQQCFLGLIHFAAMDNVKLFTACAWISFRKCSFFEIIITSRARQCFESRINARHTTKMFVASQHRTVFAGSCSRVLSTPLKNSHLKYPYSIEESLQLEGLQLLKISSSGRFGTVSTESIEYIYEKNDIQSFSIKVLISVQMIKEDGSKTATNILKRKSCVIIKRQTVECPSFQLSFG